jgi:pseudouridine synthase
MNPRKSPAGRPEPSRRKSRDAGTDDGLVRLNKYLADNGIASRRKADQLIEEGEVMIDGEIVTELGTKVDPTKQRVEVDGVVLKPEGARHRYYLLNKPSGVVCTNDHRESRPRAVDLITDRRKGRIYTVGRLDEETVGLVILTNDGDLAHRISHPRFGMTKTYQVVVRGRVTEADVEKVRKGVRLSDYRSRFNAVRLVRRSERQSRLEVTLQEGRNREIRRTFAHLGLPVKSLRRTRIGPLTDRGLKVGSWRPLTKAEVEDLIAFDPAEDARSRTSSRRHGARAPRKGRKR